MTWLQGPVAIIMAGQSPLLPATIHRPPIWTAADFPLIHDCTKGSPNRTPKLAANLKTHRIFGRLDQIDIQARSMANSILQGAPISKSRFETDHSANPDWFPDAHSGHFAAARTKRNGHSVTRLFQFLTSNPTAWIYSANSLPWNVWKLYIGIIDHPTMTNQIGKYSSSFHFNDYPGF